MAQVKVLFLKVTPPFPPFKTAPFFPVTETKLSLTHFVFWITINGKPYWSLELYCVVPQSLNLFVTCDTHFPWPPRSGVQMQACALVFFDHSDTSSKWRSRLVCCRWLTWSFGCASHGRVVIASLRSHPVLGELFRRQPLIIYPGFPPTWLCLAEQ